MGTSHPFLTIAGAGAWGTALALTAARKGSKVRVWEQSVARCIHLTTTRNHPALESIHIPEEISFTSSWKEACDGTEGIIICIPSIHLRTFSEKYLKDLEQDIPYVLGTKGIEKDTGLLPTEIIQDTCARSENVFVLAGPHLAMEVARGEVTGAILAGQGKSANVIIDALSQPAFQVSPHQDVIGAQLCSAVKNVLAIGWGILEGAGYGTNSRALFLSAGLAELARFIQVHGCSWDILLTPAGLGDTIATALSSLSRNTSFGRSLGQGARLDRALGMQPIVEGYNALPGLLKRAHHMGITLPLLEKLAHCLEAEQLVAQDIESLLNF